MRRIRDDQAIHVFGFNIHYQGCSLYKLGRYDLALKSFQKFIDMKDKDEDSIKIMPWAYIRRGNIFDLQGRRQLALEEYRKALTFQDYDSSKTEAQKRLQEPFKEANN